MLGAIRGDVRFKEPLSLHTSLRVGGVADIFVVAVDVKDVRRTLAFAHSEKLSLTVLGGGNGILVGDRGVRGVILQLGGCLERTEIRGDEVMAGAGVRLSALVREAAAHGLGGIEPLVAVPASVGGALAMDASARHVRFADAVTSVYYLYPDGTVGELKRETSRARGAPLGLRSDVIVIGARVALEHRRECDLRREIKHMLERRRAEHPLAVATAAGIWHEPAGTTAAKLIAKTGLAGQRIRNVEISAKNPDFLINRGHSRAVDVLEVMARIRERVASRFGVTLRPRIRLIGG